jgi:hypothetical protein
MKQRDNPDRLCSRMVSYNSAGFDEMNYHITGGLGLHYCLNGTAGGCDCEHWVPPFPPDSNCIPLIDHHDGTYSGAIEGYTVGHAKHATFRFFQRHQPNSEPQWPLEEVIIGAWADGTECVGGAADATFQSSGGNCFRDVIFDLDCTSHGPFAVPLESADGRTTSCVCPDGWEQLNAEQSTAPGRWQCSPAAAARAPVERAPGWVLPVVATCAGITALSIGLTWWMRKSVVAWATNGGAGLRSDLMDWTEEPAGRASSAGME